MKHYIALTLSCIALLTACMTTTPSPSPTPVPTATTEVNTLPTPTSPDSPISVPPTPRLSSQLPREMYGDLRDAVAKQLGAAPETLRMVHSQEMQWRNSSLGCPEKGMNYLQVIIPGWRIVFEDENGTQHDVHIGEDITNFIICKNPTTIEADMTPISGDINIDDAKKSALDALMKHLNVERTDISIVSIEVVEWRNSCLGCQLPNQNCLTVITPGFRIVLESGGKTYNVHTDRNGQQTIICDKPIASPTDH